MGQLVRSRWEFLRSSVMRTHLLVLASYTILTVLMTYPLILNFKKSFPGDGGDSYLYMWNYWYFKERIFHLQGPFFTDALFFPVGASLFFQSYTVVSDVLATVLFLFTSNIAVVSNSIFLLSFVLAGYFSFLLVDYLTHNKPAAFLAGTIFAFCPYTLTRLLGHFELTSTYWIPLFVLFFLKMNGPKGSYRHAVIAGIVAVLTMLDVYYYCIFLIFFVTLFYAYKLWDRQQRWTYWGWDGIKKALVLGGTALIVSAPVLSAAYKHAAAGYYDEALGWLGANEFVSDVTAFFVPSFLHPFWKSRVWNYYFQTLSSNTSTIETVVFIGWLVTILSTFASVYIARRRPELRVWRFLFIAFIILSLGPTLHFRGGYVFDFDGLSISIPLPYLLVHYIPLFNHARSPSRLIIMAMLCAAVLSAYAWIWLRERLQQQRRGLAAVFSLLILVVLLEYMNVPYPLCPSKVPAVFHKIAMDKDSGSMLELPLAIQDGVSGRGNNVRGSFWTYVQIVHHKKRVGGYTGRGVRKALAYFEQFPVVRHVLEIEEEQTIPPEEVEEDKKTVPDLIKQTSLAYIVVHPEFKDTPCHEYVREVFNLGDPVYQDDGYLVYKISGGAAKPPEPAEALDYQQAH